MSGKELLNATAVMAAEFLSATGIPGGATLSEVTRRYIEKKRREASDVFISELSNGFHGQVDFDERDCDPLLEMTFRLSKAVSDGAAKENLRLMCQVILGLKKKKAFDPDAFRKWCRILEDLTRDEILVIGTAYRTRINLPRGAPVSGERGFWEKLKQSLLTAGYKQDEIYALCSAVSRTGLLMGESALNGMIFGDTLWLMELGNLAQIDGSVDTQRS